MTATDTHRTIDAVWRIESARLIAGLTRIVRDVGLAEELAQDALVLTAEPALAGYHFLPSVRGDLLAKLGRLDEAREELERAAALTRNVRERDLLLRRAAACARGPEEPQA